MNTWCTHESENGGELTVFLKDDKISSVFAANDCSMNEYIEHAFSELGVQIEYSKLTEPELETLLDAYLA